MALLHLSRRHLGDGWMCEGFDGLLWISISLLTASFLAATLLPGSSEILLVALIVQHPDAALLFVLVATVGNTAGSVVNYVLGLWLGRPVAERFPKIVSEEWLERSEVWFNHYGMWTLLFAWVPVIGDPLTVVAGVLRTRFVPFVLLVAAGKSARYLVIAAGVQAFS